MTAISQARTSDPETSHAAIPVRPGTQLAIVVAILAEHGQATAAQICSRMPRGRNGNRPQQSVIARRLTDLGEMGYAAPTLFTHDGCRVWTLTDQGMRLRRP